MVNFVLIKFVPEVFTRNSFRCLTWFAILHPFGEATIQHLDILVTHSLKHPCCTVSKKLHGSSVVTYNSICHLDVESLHGVNEMLFRGHHKWKIGSHIFQVVQD